MEIRFYSKSPDFGWLSNFDPRGSIRIGGESWRTVEHYYQAQKFVDSALRRRIQAEKAAVAAKKLADGHAGQVREDWEDLKEDVMRRALQAKFSQHRVLRQWHLQTGQAPLIHQSSSDLFWGRAPDGRGLNRLGEMLSDLREELRKETGV